jgi:hypothetical protein
MWMPTWMLTDGANNHWFTQNMARNIPGLTLSSARIGLNDAAQEGNYIDILSFSPVLELGAWRTA